MLTSEDIQKLIEVFATREEIDKKFEEIKENFVSLQTSVDTYAKRVDT